MSSVLPGLALAIVASVALNTSYVLQHRGSASAPAISPRAPVATLRSLFRSRWWAAGAAIGIAGWVLHITALSAAPLSLVQAFVAGGLALAVPLAARIAGERIGGGEMAAVGILVLALVLLAVGLRPGPRHAQFASRTLGLWLLGLAAMAGAIAAGITGARRAAALGLAGGLLYGAADIAVKALTGAAASGGLRAVVTSPWLGAAAATTMAAFFCFQRGLQRGSAVPVIALMTAGTNVSSIAGGFLVFGEPFGRGGVVVAAHAIGLAFVCVGVWRLAPAQARLTAATGAPPPPAPALDTPPPVPVHGPTRIAPDSDPEPRPRRRAHPLRVTASGLVALLAVLSGVGLVYLERSWHILGAGPHVAGALPLQQLNGDEAQPLLRLLVAWLAAGAAAGWALARLGGLPRRAAIVIPPLLGLVLLVLLGAESDAVVINGALAHHLGGQPGQPALWVATGLLGAGAAAVTVLPGGRSRWAALRLAPVAAVLVAGGIAGGAAYAHNYWLYRGFPPPSDPRGVAPGHFAEETFYSRALHERRSYLAYLPAGYDRQAAAGRRFPVLYLLHAAPGRPDTTFKSGAIGVRYDIGLARRRLRHMLIVIPYGKSSRFSSDTEWANAAAGRYMSFVLDTVHAVDHRFATVRSRRGRAIAGYSEGGYGAINIALHNLATFSVGESWSGYFTQTPTAAFTGASRAELAANSPAAYVGHLAPTLHRRPFAAFLYVGSHDDVTPASMTRFARRLDAAGGHARAAVYPGRHTWKLWRAQMGRSLAFASRHLRGF